MIRELAYEPTPLGLLTLRVRPEPLIGGADVYEVKLGEEFLMSSLFTAGEEALADLGLEALEGELDVIVGGLGLGYTAKRVLRNQNVASLAVIELFEEVIRWHEDLLVPAAVSLISDARCRLVAGDFFAMAETGLDTSAPGRQFDAVLVDIDHTPDHHLNKEDAGFYTPKGLGFLKRQIKPGGVFGLWSTDEADDDFVNLLGEVFSSAAGHNVKFPNPYSNELAVNSVYIARN